MGEVSLRVRNALLILGVALAPVISIGARADDAGGAGVVILESDDSDGGGYADADAEDCAACHDESSRYPVLSILATRHAVRGDGRTPLASARECQTCHGPSNAHVESERDDPPPVGILFGLDAPVGPQNEVCLGCHRGGARMGWAGSRHDLMNVPCAGCHTIHAIQDPVLAKNIDPMLFRREGQAEVCFTCHKEQRAQIQQRVSSHPLREGKVVCSDCHNLHGGIGPTNLAKPTLNETCYQCHADKRGPFLWEHAPVREDCGICHQPHGSNNVSLLKARLPQMCQQCHMPSRHPSGAYGGPDPGPPTTIDRRVGSKSCLNCHSTVHGSNHPSGVRWVR